MADHEDRTSSEDLQLLAEDLLLQHPAVDQVLHDAAVDAAASAQRSCGITYLSRYGALTVASSDETANAVDELQYSRDQGPCLEALRTGSPVRVQDTLAETRWGDYPQHAAQCGVRSSLSYPVLLDGQSIGAINLYSPVAGPWAADEDATLMLISHQVAGILRSVRGLAASLVHDPQTAASFRERHDFDVATGMVMAQRNCSADQARAAIAAAAADRAGSAGEVVSEVLAGHVIGEAL